MNCRIVVIALAAALSASGCATVSLNEPPTAEASPAQADLYAASETLKDEFAERGWGLRDEEPGMARRVATMLLSGISSEPAEGPVDAYLAGLPQGPGDEAAFVVSDLKRAADLTAEVNAAADAAQQTGPEPLGAGRDLAAAESAAQAAQRAARFFDQVAAALAEDLQPVERTELEEGCARLHAAAEMLTAHADAFAERRRAAMNTLS